MSHKWLLRLGAWVAEKIEDKAGLALDFPEGGLLFAVLFDETELE
jgi:hypothetical protein